MLYTNVGVQRDKLASVVAECRASQVLSTAILLEIDSAPLSEEKTEKEEKKKNFDLR